MSFTNSSMLAFPPEGLSLRWYSELFTNPQWTLRIPVSVETAFATAMLATVLGTLAALGMTRGSFPGRGLLTALFLAPLVVPIIDLAVGDYFVWALGWQVGPVGFGGSLAGTVPGLVLAHTVLAFPFPFLTVSTSLTTVDRTLELAAGGLGANPWKTFQKITLPLIRTGVITGAIFAFLTSWDEVVVASFLASPPVSTRPVHLAARTVRKREDDRAQADRRVSATRRRKYRGQRQRHHEPAGAPPKHRHGLPELCAVPAHDRGPEHRVRPGAAPLHPQGDHQGGRRVAGHGAPEGLCVPPARGAIGGAAATGRAGPCARLQTAAAAP